MIASRETYEAGLEVARDTLLVAALLGAAGSERAGTTRIGALAGVGGRTAGDGLELLGEVEELTEVRNAVIGQEPIVVVPVELLANEGTGLEGLHRLDDEQVGDVDEGVAGLGLHVLLSDDNALLRMSSY